MVIDLAGAAVEFRFADAGLAARVESRCRLFLSDASPDWRVDVDTFEPRRERLPRPFLPEVEASDGRLRFSRGDARFELSGRRGRLDIWPNPWSFDAAARIIYSRLLAPKRAFLLHAAALAFGRRALLVPGPSGAGKTTLVRTCGEGAALGDELVLVSPSKDGHEAFATPFWGNGREAQRTGRGRVRGVAFLERAERPGLRPLSKREAMKRASRCLVWFGGAGPGLAAVWGELAELVGRSPAYSLSFRKGTPPWTLLKEAVG